jgi:hypothetical protein
MGVFRAIRKRTVAAVAVAGLVGTGVSLIVDTAALAAEICPYPYVCFEDFNSQGYLYITAKYQVVTDYEQTISSTVVQYSRWIVNTRHDDVAYIRFAYPTSTTCIRPNSTLNPGSIGAAQALSIRISWSSSC